ncbi:MAG: glycosyltransferase family 4 protein [Deltaproteobacteria bacterium]|nr:glycosyltransferase family 4 protein [Deltaproteobacteria bacterium]
MKKILVLDTGKEWGGGTNSLIELLKRADRKRFAFSVLFYDNYKKGEDSDVKTEIERLGVSFKLIERPRTGIGVKAAREAGRAALSLSAALKKKYLFNLDYKHRIVPASETIADELKGFDGLYMNNQPSSNLEGILAASVVGVPCVQHTRIETRLNAMEAKAVNDHVAKVVCVSNGVRDSLIVSGVEPDKCVVVHNGIDLSARPIEDRDDVRRRLGISTEALVLGTVGSLVKRKRVDMLIEAVSVMQGSIGGLLIVGNGPEMQRLKNIATKTGIGDKTVFTGFCTDALSYINAMDIFVLASEKEGLPRVILEAMLMAKPVAAFDVAGASELIDHGVTGMVVKEEGAASLAKALAEIIKDRTRLKTMGEAGRARVSALFGMDRYVSGVEAVIAEVFR